MRKQFAQVYGEKEALERIINSCDYNSRISGKYSVTVSDIP
jgi:hypothetical protein